MSIRAPLFSNQSMLAAIFAQIFREFRRFSEILPGFYRILLRLSPNQNYWGCDCTPDAYTSVSRCNIVLRCNLLVVLTYLEYHFFSFKLKHFCLNINVNYSSAAKNFVREGQVNDVVSH